MAYYYPVHPVVPAPYVVTAAPVWVPTAPIVYTYTPAPQPQPQPRPRHRVPQAAASPRHLEPPTDPLCERCYTRFMNNPRTQQYHAIAAMYHQMQPHNPMCGECESPLVACPLCRRRCGCRVIRQRTIQKLMEISDDEREPMAQREPLRLLPPPPKRTPTPSRKAQRITDYDNDSKRNVRSNSRPAAQRLNSYGSQQLPHELHRKNSRPGSASSNDYQEYDTLDMTAPAETNSDPYERGIEDWVASIRLTEQGDPDERDLDTDMEFVSEDPGPSLHRSNSLKRSNSKGRLHGHQRKGLRGLLGNFLGGSDERS